MLGRQKRFLFTLKISARAAYFTPLQQFILRLIENTSMRMRNYLYMKNATNTSKDPPHKYKNIFLPLYQMIFYIILRFLIAINGINLMTIYKFSYSHKLNAGNIIALLCFGWIVSAKLNQVKIDWELRKLLVRRARR